VILNKDGQQIFNCNIATTAIPSFEGYLHYHQGALVDVRSVALRLAIECCRAQEPDVFRDQISVLGLSGLVAAMLTGTRQDFQQQLLNTPNLPATSNFNLDLSDDEWQRLTTGSSLDSILFTGLDLDERSFSDVTDVNFRRRSTEKEPSQELRSLLYHIAEEDAKRQAYMHRGVHCEECGQVIKGIRWHCLQCLDFDLCSTCEVGSRHTSSHVFAKIKIPIPWLYNKLDRSFENWYPGPNLPGAGEPYMNCDTAELASKYSFSAPQIEAFFEQFACLVNVEWEEDPTGIRWALDRRAFNAALSHQRWRSQTAASLLYERMFNFYDTDGNGLLGFEEFVSGLAYLRGVERMASLDRALRGYDLDGDGYIDRKDMLCIMEANFIISREITNDMVDAQELAQIGDNDAMESLRGRQPVSAILQEGDMDDREERPVNGKVADSFGDRQPAPGASTIIGAEEMWPTDVTPRALAPEASESYEKYQAYLLMLRDPSKQTDSASSEYTDDAASTEKKDDEKPATAPVIRSGTGSRGILWDLVVRSLNELLDNIFLSRENDEKAATETAKLRHDRQEEIQQFIENEEKVSEEALTADSIDAGSNAFVSEIPTPQPCAIIYSTATSEAADLTSPDVAPLTTPATQDTAPTAIDVSEVTSDSPEYSLDKLVALEKVARSVKSRGGPGRLSYDEIESAANARENIRALVRTWLDYASF
jgi:Ca2+-binding EF-hand superfamily protein